METPQDNLFSVENVLAVVEGASRDGNAYLARCPAHPDRHPSLRISRGRNGQAVVHCFSCPDKKAAFQAILERVRNRFGSGLVAPLPPVDLEPEEDREFDAVAALSELGKWQAVRWEAFVEVPHDFLVGRGISADVADEFGYGYSEDRNALVLPTFWQGSLIGLKFRSLNPNPGFKWWQMRGSQQDVLMGADLDPIDPDSKVVAIFEAPLDLALVRSLGFNAATLISANIPGTERFRAGIDLLKQKYDHVLLIGDNDAPGIAAMQTLRNLIGPGAVFARLPGAVKDIGDYWQADPTECRAWLARTYATAADATPIPRTTLDKLRLRLQQAAGVLSQPDADSGLVLPGLLRELSEAAQSDALEFPQPLGADALNGLVGEFVDAALPFSEASAEALVYQFISAIGNCFGQSMYANFGADRHYPGLFTLIVGSTASGKGQSLSSVRALMREVDPEWAQNHCRSSAASGEGLVRLASENEHDGRLFLILPEVTTLLNSMNREGSNLSGYLRLGYDRSPLENQKSKGGIVARDYLLSVVGHVTPAELTETLGNVDFYNGAVNRFLWAVVRKSKTLPRMSSAPDFTLLADKLRRLLALPDPGAVDFDASAGQVWDAWVCGLPELDGKLAAACERAKPNALRTALVYAALDEARLTGEQMWIRERHVKAAIEIVTRSRESVRWFLSRPAEGKASRNSEEIARIKIAVNQGGGMITASQLTQLFSHKTAEQRIEIASRAGLKLRRGERGDKSGRPVDRWTW